MATRTRTGGVAGLRRFLGGFADGGTAGAWGAPWDGATNWVKDRVGDIVGGIKNVVVGALRKAAEAAFSPLRNTLDDVPGGMLGDLAIAPPKALMDGILAFLGKKDDEAPSPGYGTLAGSTWHALVDFIPSTGVQDVVTSTFRPGGTSFHGKNKAADFSVGGHGNRGYGDPWLRGIFNASVPVAGSLSELLLAGAPFNIKNGRHVPGYAWGRPPARQPLEPRPRCPVRPGGRLQPGLSMVMNAAGSPELVLNQQQESAIEAVLSGRLTPADVLAAGGEFPDTDYWREARRVMADAQARRQHLLARNR